MVVLAEKALLESRGHTVRLLEADNRAIEGALGSFRAAFSAVWSSASGRRVAREIAQFAPDVLHVHNFFPLLSPSIHVAAGRGGVPVVQTLHNYRLLCPTGLLFREGAACEECLGRRVPWPGVLHGCYRKSRAATLPVAAMLAAHNLRRTWHREVQVFVALTEFARRKFIEGGLPADRIMVKPHFVDPSPSVGLGRGGYALFVGRISVEKGLATALDAWREGRLGGRLPLRIAGEGPLDASLRARASGVAGVEWLGTVPQARLMGLLQDASCLVFPSVCYETFGRSIIEAFATGTPVIAAGHGSAAALVRDGETGLLFRPGDARDLVLKVEAHLEDGAGRARMRAAVRAEYERNYTAEANHRQLTEIYARALRREVAAANRAG